MKNILKNTYNSLKRGNDVGLLLQDGVSMVLQIFDTFDDINTMLISIIERFEANSNYTILLQLRFSYTFLKENFDLEVNTFLAKIFSMNYF